MTEGDGVALYSTRHPLNITEEMLAAGASQITNATQRAGLNEMLRNIYTAMSDAAPPEPDLEISEDALQTVVMEISLPEATVEQLAMRASQATHGMWASLGDDQKEHWRAWVRDLADAVFEAEHELRVVNE